MRIVIPNQPSGTNLIIRARSKSGSDYSDWSRNFTVTTSGDTTAPKTPANPVGSMSGTSFTLKWDAVTQSSDNSPANDLDRYEVLVTSSGSANTNVYVTNDTKFEFSFEQNASLFGSPQGNVRMSVRAVDTSGNPSAYTSVISQTNAAPSAPTGLAGSASTYMLAFSWNAVTDLDLKQYRIYSGTTSGSQTTLVWTGTALAAAVQVLDSTTDKWYKVVAVDVFNTESATSNVVGPLKPLSPVTVDTVAPAIPTSLAGTLTNSTDGKTASMAVTWTGVADSDLDSYIVAFRQQASPVNDWQYVTVDKATTSTTIQGLVPYKAYDIRIRAKDFSANYSNWTTIVAVTAQANTAPAVPTGLAATAGKDNLQISWTENAEPDMANNAGTYDVTVATNSGFTTGVLQYRTSATTLSVNGLATNTQYWVRVRATDSGGLPSAYSASANATTSNFPTTALSDGAVPTGAVTLSASAGVGYIYLNWTTLANADPVIYDVYMSTTSGFTTYDATTKITEVSGTSAFIDTVVGGATLAYGTTYYFKVRARDRDGSSTSVSNQVSAAPVQAGSSDLSGPLNAVITNSDATNVNATFADWPTGSSLPNGWVAWGGNGIAIGKESTLVNGSPYGIRFNVTPSTTAAGFTTDSGVGKSLSTLPLDLDYVTVTVEFLLNSGTSISGAGLLLDWVGTNSNSSLIRANVPLNTDVPAPVLGKWYKVTKIVKRPPQANVTPQTSWSMFVMANYGSGFGATTAKDIVFNRVGIRPSTNEEITAYNSASAASVTDLDARVASKATDLITNGSGLLGTNYNFPGFDYNGADAPTGANGSFVIKTTVNQSSTITENIPFDPTKAYKFSFQCRQTVPGATGNNMYGFLSAFDAFNLSIGPQNYMYIANTTTTLAAPLNPGDTTITLTSAANWFGQAGKPAGSSVYLRNAIFWDYVDAGGKAWPVGTYSRNLLSPNATSMWADGGIVGNVITLSAPYAGTAKPAGTSLSNASAGGSYIYMPSATNTVVPETWTTYTDVFSAGIMNPSLQAVTTTGNASWTNGMPPGTAKIRVGWLLNYPSGGGKLAVASVSLSDAAAAQATANAVKTDLASNYSNTTAMNNAILISANGKNKSTYSASAPGTAANIVGDIWFQQDGTGKILGQWIGAGGTSWTSVTLRSEIIASLDAGKITAGSTFTNDLNVKSTFTLGDATTPGVIKSYNYALNTTGFSLSSAGLQINNGDIDAKTLRANSSFVTNLFVGTGGAIQSTGFNSTTGFQLSTGGLIIRGAGNSVDVAAVTAGTITGKQWIMGTGGSFIVDQTGYFQSNNFGATTGWKLDSAGLTINQGTIDAKALISSTIDTATLTLSGPNGKIVGNGFSLAGTGLIITSGSIAAPALQIQSGASNLEHPEYSAFEFTSSFYTGKFSTANATTSIQTTGGVQGNQFLRVSTTTAAAASCVIGDTATDYHVTVEAGKTYIFSAWMKASTATAQSAYLRPRYSDGSFGSGGGATPSLPGSGAWTRYSWAYTVPAGITSLVVQLFNNSTTAGAGVDIDGLMVEQQVGGLTTPSTYVMPGMTSADGGFLRTGSIISNANVMVNSVSQPAWSINMAGGAQFGNAVVRGSLLVGTSSDADNGESFIASGNFVSGSSGWKIDSAGSVEFNSGTFRGPISASQITGGVIQSDISINGIIKTAETGQRTEIDSEGIHQFGPDGISVIVDLPNDPGQTARFTGLVNATGIVISDGMELRGKTNLFSMGSITTLATTTSGSSTAPSLSIDWDKYDGDIWENGYSTLGFHHEDDNVSRYSVHNTYNYGLFKGPTGKYAFPEVTTNTGSKRGTWAPFSMAMINIGTGVRMVTFGSKCPANGSSETFHFRSYDVSTMVAGGTVAPVQKVEIASPNVQNYVVQNVIGRCFSPSGSAALESNFSHAEFNQLSSPKTITFRRYAVTDAAITIQGSALVVNSPFAAGENMSGVVYGSSALMGMPGADQNIWIVFGTQNAYAFSTAGARLTAFDFPLPAGVGNIDAMGSTVAGVNGFIGFRSAVTNNSNTPIFVNKHTSTHWAATDSAVWWAGYTWNDSDSGGTGQHETNVSTLSSITMKKRARLTVTTPALPDPATGAGTARGNDDVNSFRLYMQRQATAPTRTALWKQSTQPADLSTVVTLTSMPQWAATSNPPAATNFPSSASAVMQSSSIGADGLPKFKLSGDGTSHFEALDVSGLGSNAFSGKAFDQLFYGIRAQARLFGGGTQSVSSAFEVSWSSRFMVISLGNDATLANTGRFEIMMPPVGTVIPGYGGATSKTVTTGGIPLSTWEALYYQIPYGAATEASNPANFKVVSYSSAFKVPNDWILICIKQNDAALVEFAGGQRVKPTTAYYMPDDWLAPTFANSWVNFGSGYQTAGYRRTTEGRVLLRGLVKSGTVNVPMFTLPVGYRPTGHEQFNMTASTGVADVRVFSSGIVQVAGYFAGGTNGSVSLSGIAFDVY